jgi:hypothetical protein
MTEPGLSGDVADGGSGLPQSMDLIKDGLPRATMRLAGEVSMFWRLRLGHPDHLRSSRRLHRWISATKRGPLIGLRDSAAGVVERVRRDRTLGLALGVTFYEMLTGKLPFAAAGRNRRHARRDSTPKMTYTHLH